MSPEWALASSGTKPEDQARRARPRSAQDGGGGDMRSSIRRSSPRFAVVATLLPTDRRACDRCTTSEDV
jgi:hypothetical protein